MGYRPGFSKSLGFEYKFPPVGFLFQSPLVCIIQGLRVIIIIDGYTKDFSLEETEIDMLYYLMVMRLVTSITMTSHSAKQHPDNNYILISQKPAKALLKKLEDEKNMLR